MTGMTIPKPRRSTRTTTKRMPREAWRRTGADLNRDRPGSHAPVGPLEVRSRYGEGEVAGPGDPLQLHVPGRRLDREHELVARRERERRERDLHLEDPEEHG